MKKVAPTANLVSKSLNIKLNDTEIFKSFNNEVVQINSVCAGKRGDAVMWNKAARMYLPTGENLYAVRKITWIDGDYEKTQSFIFRDGKFKTVKPFGQVMTASEVYIKESPIRGLGQGFDELLVLEEALEGNAEAVLEVQQFLNKREINEKITLAKKTIEHESLGVQQLLRAQSDEFNHIRKAKNIPFGIKMQLLSDLYGYKYNHTEHTSLFQGKDKCEEHRKNELKKSRVLKEGEAKDFTFVSLEEMRERASRVQEKVSVCHEHDFGFELEPHRKTKADEQEYFSGIKLPQVIMAEKIAKKAFEFAWALERKEVNETFLQTDEGKTLQEWYYKKEEHVTQVDRVTEVIKEFPSAEWAFGKIVVGEENMYITTNCLFVEKEVLQEMKSATAMTWEDADGFRVFHDPKNDEEYYEHKNGEEVMQSDELQPDEILMDKEEA